MIENLCLMGIGTCANINLVPTEYSGGLIRYYELLSLIGIIFAGFQFLDSKKIRRLLFIRFRLSLITVIMLSISFLLISYILPGLPGPAFILFGYPYFWKVLSLITISIAIIFLLLFSFYHNDLKWIPKYSNTHRSKLINDIGYYSIYEDGSEESYEAFSRILNANLNLIFETMGLFKYNNYILSPPYQNRENRIEIMRSVLGKNNKKISIIENGFELLDEILPNEGFCKYLVEKNYALLFNIYSLAEKHKLWETTGNNLLSTLSSVLFSNNNSLIRKELSNDGYYKNKWLFKTITNSKGLLENFNILDADFEVNKDNERLCITLCESVMVSYFSTEENQSYKFGSSIKGLLEKILNPYRYLQNLDESEIDMHMFITHIHRILIDGNSYGRISSMFFSKHEKEISDNSVLGKIVDLLFHRFEIMMRKDQKKWYIYSQAYWWIIWSHLEETDLENDDSRETIQNFRSEFLKKINERIYEREPMHGFGDNNSMIKLLLSIFGWKLNTGYFKDDEIIAKWVEEKFNNEWGSKFLVDEKFRLSSLPDGLTVEDGKILDSGHYGNRQIFPIL